MNFPRVLVSLFLLTLSTPSFATDGWYEFFDKNFTVTHSGTDVQVGVLTQPAPRGTVLYMPGFADTIDNHETLLKSFRAQGMQVIAFDYPGHGKSGGKIAWWTLESLAEIIPTVLADQRSGFDSSLPMILAGWSTGGTISIRIAQSWSHVIPSGTRLAGVIAYAPAVPAHIVVKVDKTKVTDGYMKRGPSPTSVPLVGKFAASITLQSRAAAGQSFPASMNALIIVAGDDDHFAQSRPAVSWVKDQGEQVLGFQCVGSMHGFEFQPAFGGEAQAVATQFAVAAARGDISALRGRAGVRCPRIRN